MNRSAPASKVRYLVSISELVEPGASENPTLWRGTYTDANGAATLSAVEPGNYTLRIFGLGVADRVIVVPDEAGPLDAADLSGGSPHGRLRGQAHDTYWDPDNSRSYICTGGTNWQEITG